MEKGAVKTTKTKDEIIATWKEYYDWLDSVYPIIKFEIEGKYGDVLHFFRGFNSRMLDGENTLIYFLRDEGYKDIIEEERKQRLLGEEEKTSIVESKTIFEPQAFICIDKDEKYFNFGVEWDYQNKGYGRAIYENYLEILKKLGIENPDEYQLRLYGSSKHDFLKSRLTQKLVQKTNSEPNLERAMQILEEFAKYPNTMKFSEFNSIIEYAINSNVPMEEISNAINENGFNIFYSTVNFVPKFEDVDFKKFKSFGIKGLKATAMHDHFMKNRNCGFMNLLDDVDSKDATLEFKRIFDEVKKANEEDNDFSYSYNISRYGELGFLILDWEHFGLLAKNLSPEIKEIIRKQAIEQFDSFDGEHMYPWAYSNIDHNTRATIEMLKEAELFDKDTYIALYQKALNRNYDLEEFDKLTAHCINYEERQKAQNEISKYLFCPNPKGKWQKNCSFGAHHKQTKISVPKKFAENGDLIEMLRQKISSQGIAIKTKIKTDMTGIDENGKKINVDNLEDWLFGVPGADGNLQFIGNNSIQLPPQTPKKVIDIVKQCVKSLEYSSLELR